MKTEFQWSNSHLHRTFLSWDINCWSLFTQFEMVDCTIICDVILVLLKLQSLFFFVFSKATAPCAKMWSLSHCYRVTWWFKPSPYNLLCKGIVNVSRSYKHINFKGKQKQVMWVVQEGHQKLLRNRLFQIKWINFNILYLSNGISYENGSWMNGIHFPTSKTYILRIFDFRSTLTAGPYVLWKLTEQTLRKQYINFCRDV